MKEILRAVLTVGAAVAVVLAVEGARERPVVVRDGGAREDRTPELLARLDALEGRLAAEVAALRAEAADAQAPAAAGPGVAERLTHLEEGIAALRAAPAHDAPPREEDERFRGLSNLELRAHAVALSQEPGAEAVDAWCTLLRRELAPEERVQALDDLAHVHVKLKDWTSAAARWSEAIETVGGRGTPRGQGFSHSLAWARSYGGDPGAARDELDRLLAEPNVTEAVEASARSAAASFSIQLGDDGRAREELERIVDRWARSPEEHYRRIAESAARRLAELN